MSDIRIRARKLLEHSTEFLWANLVGEFTLIFDDGEVKTNARETCYSSYSWDMIRQYPQTKFLRKHHVKAIIGNGVIGSKTHLTLLGNVGWSVHDAYRDLGVPTRDQIAQMIYRKCNDMYNDLIIKSEPYVVTVDILDFVQVLKHPKVEKVMDEVEQTTESVMDARQKVSEVLLDPAELPNNSLGRLFRSNLINRSQLLQCVSPRGRLTDIDSDMFKGLILRGYAQGLRSLHDLAIESRAAAKSLFFSKEPLQQAEYFSRRLQLLCQVVKNLHHTDCRSGKYLNWKVRPPVFRGDKKISDGDLELLEGKYYLDESDGSLKAVRASDHFLIGRTLKIRSLIAGCAHPDWYGVCSTCFGELSYSVPSKTNLGHMCSTSMTQKSSQSVLSVKHDAAVAEAEDIYIADHLKDYLAVSGDGGSYMLSPKLKGKRFKLVFFAPSVPGLTDINMVDDIGDLNTSRVSEIEHISIMVERSMGDWDVIPAQVNVKRRKASISYSLLEFIKQKRWENDERGNYVIDMDGWNFNKKILTLPLKHHNMADHSKEIADVIESSAKRLRERDDVQNPQAVLVELSDLVNSKLKVNLAVLEVTLHAACVISSENKDYRLPKAWTTSEVGISENTLPNRSLAPVMAYEKQKKWIMSPQSFFSRGRMSHPMDVHLCPREAALEVRPDIYN